MPYTMEDFKREIRQEVLEQISAEEKLFKEFVDQLPHQKRLRVLEGLPVEEILSSLSPEAIENYLQKLRRKAPNSE